MRLFWVFWLELHKCPGKIIYYLLFYFSQILSCFAFPSFCKPRACFFFAKTFWQSWETVDLQEYLYFQQGTIILLWVLTSLIRLWWVMYEGSFQVCDGRWWKKIRECQALKLGDAPMHPQKIFKETQASKLGDAPKGVPSFFNKYRYVFGFVSFMRYVQILKRLLHLVFTFLWCTMLVWDSPWLIYRMLIALHLYLLSMAL